MPCRSSPQCQASTHAPALAWPLPCPDAAGGAPIPAKPEARAPRPAPPGATHSVRYPGHSCQTQSAYRGSLAGIATAHGTPPCLPGVYNEKIIQPLWSHYSMGASGEVSFAAWQYYGIGGRRHRRRTAREHGHVSACESRSRCAPLEAADTCVTEGSCPLKHHDEHTGVAWRAPWNLCIFWSWILMQRLVRQITADDLLSYCGACWPRDASMCRLLLMCFPKHALLPLISSFSVPQ
jgi:hypothetical protein